MTQTHLAAAHGHVVPRPDGLVARCGGPALCSACRDELDEAGTAALAAALTIIGEDRAAEHAREVRKGLALQGWTIAPLRGARR